MIRTFNEPKPLLTSLDCAEAIINKWEIESLLYYESVYVMYLNDLNIPIEIRRLNDGDSINVVIDIPRAMRYAIGHHCAAFVVCHNQISGNPRPSPDDLEITETLLNISNAIDITLLDHLIITPKSYYSFADNGLLETKDLGLFKCA